MQANQTAQINYNLNKLRSSLIVAAYTTVRDSWHDTIPSTVFNTLYLIESGEGHLIIDGVDYFPKAGDFVFIPENSSYTYSTCDTNRYTKYWCHFEADVATVPLNAFFDFPRVIPASNYALTAHLFENLVTNDLNNIPFAALQANGILLELLFIFFNDCSGGVTTKSNTSNTIVKIVDYIEQNLHRKITISELADYVHLNSSYFCTLFSASIGTSPIEYINRRRIDLAKTMLLENTLTIEKMAYALGFNSPYYFSNTFKKYTGLSPTQYRHSVIT